VGCKERGCCEADGRRHAHYPVKRFCAGDFEARIKRQQNCSSWNSTPTLHATLTRCFARKADVAYVAASIWNRGFLGAVCAVTIAREMLLCDVRPARWGAPC